MQKQWGNIRTTTGSTHEIKIFAWRVLQKRRGVGENALKMIAKVGDVLKKSHQKGHRKVSVSHGLLARS